MPCMSRRHLRVKRTSGPSGLAVCMVIGCVVRDLHELLIPFSTSELFAASPSASSIAHHKLLRRHRCSLHHVYHFLANKNAYRHRQRGTFIGTGFLAIPPI